ncbi:Carcinoembryonic antigen-related cell adhesion molecule 5, partial [Lemmus lemmus]
GKKVFFGRAYSGRETLNSDGSLLLHSVSRKDRGLYVLRILKTDGTKYEDAKVQLEVDSSLSVFCNALTSSQLMIQPVPRYAAEGENVLLQVHNLPEEVQVLSWHKSINGSAVRKLIEYNRAKPSISWWPEQRIRGKLYKNGSLLLQDVIESDAGMYTLEVLNKDSKIERANVEFYLKTSLLTFWHLSSTAHETTVSVPPIVSEGDDVLFLVHNLPEEIESLAWFKGLGDAAEEIASYALHSGLSRPGPVHSSRETIYHNGSMLFEKVNLKDTEFYTLRTYNRSGKIVSTANVYLNVYGSHSLFCDTLTSSKLMIQAEPRYVSEGEDVLLQVHNLPEDVQAFSWHKSKNGNPIFKLNRVTPSISWDGAQKTKGMAFQNGSLLLQDITKKDAGIYTLEVLNKDFKIERAYVKFSVKKPVTQPFVRITDTTVTGGTSVIFTCVSPNTDVSVRWIFNKKNLQLTERMTLSPTKCGLRIDPVKSEDAGEYQCEVSNHFGLKTSLPVSWP